FISNYYHQFYNEDSLATREELVRFSPQFGARFSFFPHHYFGAEVEGNMTLASTKDSDQRINLFGLRAHVIGQIPGRLTPFVLLGGGIIHTRSDDDVHGNDTDAPLHAGVGARFFVTENVAIRADARLLRGPSAKDPYTLDASYGELMLGVSFSPGPFKAEKVAPLDRDGDGVVDAADACPDHAGTEPNGCPVPDADGDGDGIPLPDDKCPDEAETVNGYQDTDGCPDVVPDTDGDGIHELLDKCPNELEDVDGVEDDDGCPDTEPEAAPAPPAQTSVVA